MKRWLACLVAGCALFATTATARLGESVGPPQASNIQVKQATRHDLSPTLRELEKQRVAVKPSPGAIPREIPNRIKPKDLWFKPRAKPPALSKDPLVNNIRMAQRLDPAPEPLLVIEGTSNADNEAIVGFRLAPPDTQGDVGAQHYVQWNNLIFEIYDKTTGASVLGPLAGNALFEGFGGVCESNNSGDPITLYDALADRWVMTQFSPNEGIQCFAISQTPDPTGAYHRYEFTVSPGEFNDYPKFAVWHDAYYGTHRIFFNFHMIFTAFERDKMLAGDATAALVIFDVGGCPDAAGQCNEGILPVSLEGMAAAPPGTPGLFVQSYDDEAFDNAPDATQDFYRVWQMTVNWADPASSTLTDPVRVPTEEMDINLCGFGACPPQPGTGTLLDSLSFFTMHRAVYRNFGDHQAVFVNNSVDVGGDRAGIRWAELRDVETPAPTVFQAGTHGPDDGIHRWMGSIAVDVNGNVALGYSASSTTLFPSIRYAGRLAGDPAGTLPQTEQSLHEGTGSQTSPNRWGDYSAMQVDDFDGCTFWYTTEYYETTGSFDWRTKIGSFKFPTCAIGPQGTVEGTVTASNGTPIAGARVETQEGGGTLTDENGHYSLTLLVGTYDLTASAFGFAPETVTGIEVAEGETITQDFSLTQLPLVRLDGFVTDGSGPGWPLYAKVVIAPTGGGPITTLFTRPATGYYTTRAVASTEYSITVTSQIPGYDMETRTVTTGTGNLQENFELQASPSCTAPGYSFVAEELATTDFESGIPGDWTVTNNTLNCAVTDNQWNTNDPGGRTNLTGGTGLFAVADSDVCGSSVTYDSDMTTQVFDLSGAGSNDELRIEWKHDYFDLGSIAQVQVFDGTDWVTVADFSGASDRGPQTEVVQTTVGVGAANAQVRWRYQADWDWWWEVDDVKIEVGSCQFQNGGLFFGNVYDLNTGEALNGATVSVDNGGSTQTVATPEDARVDDGYYVLFSPLASGTRTLTAELSGYQTTTRRAIQVPNGLRRVNFQLPAGMLSVDPEELRMRLSFDSTGALDWLISNTGTADANFQVLELPAASTNSAEQRFDQKRSDLPFNMETKEGYHASTGFTARGLPQAPKKEVPTLPAAGEYLGEFDSGLSLPWGVGYEPGRDSVWLSNPGVGGGDDLDHRFISDGTPTDDTIDALFDAGVWAGDLAANHRTGMLWQVNVGGDNCIYELDPVALTQTGNSICAEGVAISHRGLAYNTTDDTYFMGGWNTSTVVEFTSDGTTLREVNIGLAISGLAYNANTGHLFVQVNAADQQIHVFDVTEDFVEIGSFVVQNSSGGNAFAAFEGAGLEIGCDGSLWAANQISGVVFRADSNEPGACSTDVPWLSVDPSEGTVAAGGSLTAVVGFDSNPLITAGCYGANLLLSNDTPYGSLMTAVGLTVQYNDVPAGSPGDASIHGLASAGVTFGCGAGNFCPDDSLRRRTMPIWLLRSMFGADYNPPSAIGIFADVPPESAGADFIEDLYNRGIVNACGTDPLRYCPNAAPRRGQMAQFLLKTLEGADYVPPACAGIFGDLPCSNQFAAWAEDAYNRGFMAACSTEPLHFCAQLVVPRHQSAEHLTSTFAIPTCPQ